MNKLTFEEFEVLTFIERNQKNNCFNEDILNNSIFSKKIVLKVLLSLKKDNLVKEKNYLYTVTEKGYLCLEPYRVKKAIFMAAGFGSRMVPITLKTPKPLIRVNGKRIIETLIEALLDVGIDDIIIVRGYLGEQFDELLKKYPTIKFVENPIYNEANNISSVYLIRDMLENAYLLESDLLLYDKSILRKYEYTSNCLGMAVKYTDDWCFETENGYIKSLHVGGENVFHEFGISYWTAEDGKKLKEDYEKVFNSPGGKERYYDEVPFKECIENYNVIVRPVRPGSIIEIDTYSELRELDTTYE